MQHSPSARTTHSSHRPPLSPFLYDLGAASQALPLAAVLPSQFYSSPVNANASRGEVALMRAVLEDAIECFQKQAFKSGRRVQRLAQEAEEWFFTDDQQWPFSFINICNVLGVDADYIRRGLKQLRQQQPPLETQRRQATPPHRHVPIAA